MAWDISAGATSYQVERSTDGVNYTIVNSPASNYYTDLTPTIGQLYYYQVASTNSDGTSGYTDPQSIVATLAGEMSLAELGNAALFKADRIGSQAIPLPNLNQMINSSLMELYDLLITAYEDYYKAPNASFPTTGNQQYYPVPNGVLTFRADDGTTFVPPPMYKLLGVDLNVGGFNNGYVTVDKFNFAERNRYVYPNVSTQMYGNYNLQYRWMGSDVEFIPVPSSNQTLRFQYIPKLPILLKPWDITTTNVSGWLEYVTTDVAIKILQQEESDVQVLMAQKAALKLRIEQASQNKDAGKPDTISNVQDRSRNNGWNGPLGW